MPGPGPGMTDATDAELRSLLFDCMKLWNVNANVVGGDDGIEIIASTGTYRVQRAPANMRPVRWFLHRPGRPPRAVPSIVALLSALRNALGAEGGNRLRIGS